MSQGNQGASSRMHEGQRGASQHRSGGNQGNERLGAQMQQMGRSSHDHHGEGQLAQVTNDMVCYLTDYAKQNPGYAALWCLGIGFVLGWKLKPW